MINGIAGGIVRFINKILKVNVATDGYIIVNGKRFYSLKTAITANVTTTSAPVGSFGWTTHATGRNKIFYSDGTIWQVFSTLAFTPGTHVNLTSAVITDNSGGTANMTIQLIPVITDSPASADALRDDIVTNVVPVLANNFADVAAMLNKHTTEIAALRTSLEGNGVLAGS